MPPTALHCDCRRKVGEVKDAMNAAAGGAQASRRIAAEAGREYILHKEEEEELRREEERREREAGARERQAQREREAAQRSRPPWAPAGPGRMPAPLELLLRHPVALPGGAGGAGAAGAPGPPAGESEGEVAQQTLNICFDVEARGDSSDSGG